MPIFVSICIVLASLSLMVGCSAIKQQQSFGPTGFTIGPQGNYNYSLPSINKGNTVNFNFSSSGALVNYYVYDPNNNTILTGNGGNKVASGAGIFHCGKLRGIYNPISLYWDNQFVSNNNQWYY